MSKTNFLKYILFLSTVAFLTFGCKNVDSAITSLSEADISKKKKAAEYLFSNAAKIKLRHLPAIEAKLKFIKDEELTFKIIKALSLLKDKKVCGLLLRYLSRINYKAKSSRTLWAILEIFVDNNDKRILKAMPVRLRFNRSNYKAFAWVYSEFSDLRYFKDLYVIYKSAPAGEIKLYLRVSLNKILKKNGIHLSSEKQIATLLSMLRTTWDYIPGTSRAFEEDLSELENRSAHESDTSRPSNAGVLRESLERALDNAGTRRAITTVKKKKRKDRLNH
jgi:hypothetical protein